MPDAWVQQHVAASSCYSTAGHKRSTGLKMEIKYCNLEVHAQG
jgi:hypothetical protein